jgi:uncharacterized protein YciI
MSYFTVVREAGPAWIDGKGAFDQPGVDDHTSFMNALADDGFILLAGPLAGSEQDRLRVLLVVDAAGETEIRERIARDPWAADERSASRASSRGLSSSAPVVSSPR